MIVLLLGVMGVLATVKQLLAVLMVNSGLMR